MSGIPRCIAACLLGAWLGACTEPHFEVEDAGGRRDEVDADSETVTTDDDAGASAADRGDAATSPVDTPDAAPAACKTACSDAALDAGTPPSDAGPSVSGGDAALVQADGGLDPIRANWAGRYATRSFVFSYDSMIKTYASYLTLAQIKPTPDGGLVLEEEICRFESTFNAVYTAHLLVDYPVGTKLSAPLMFDANGFESGFASTQIGYGSAPADCVPGMTSSASSPVRPWLSNNVCDCPRDTSMPPTSLRDCRVNDSDGDMQPGNTFRITFNGVGVFRVVQEQQLRLLKGFRAGDRLFAQRKSADVTRVLACTIEGQVKRIEDCPLGTVGPCSPMFHKVELVPIPENVGCAEIRDREQLFQATQPDFPAGCVAP